MNLISYFKKNWPYMFAKALIMIPLTYHIGYVRGHMAHEDDMRGRYVQQVSQQTLTFAYEDNRYVIDTGKLTLKCYALDDKSGLEKIFE
jgi:uncharacterized surface protein with fasciclin (FAS1) repeats